MKVVSGTSMPDQTIGPSGRRTDTPRRTSRLMDTSQIDKARSDHPDGEPSRRGRLARWGRRALIIAALVTMLLLALRWWMPTSEKQLAAFDAVRAVRDEDNAALIYAELLQGEEVPPEAWVSKVAPLMDNLMDPMSLRELNAAGRKLRELELSEGISDPNAARLIGLRPWKSAECPGLKLWLDRHRRRIDRLQEAACKPSCYFPASPASGRMGLFDIPVEVFRQNAFLLRYAANHDFGEGNVDEGLAKCVSLLSLGRHLRAQPTANCLSTSIGCEAMALHRLAVFVVEEQPTDRHLQDLALCCQDSSDEWEVLRQDINRVRRIFAGLLEDRRPLRMRMGTWFYSVLDKGRDRLEERRGELYHRMLSERRGLRLLIELRRFKERTGQWPDSLDQIAASVPPEALLDPSGNGPYAYRRIEGGFSLHSVGPNRIDEGGQHKEKGPDDWPIWPPRGRTLKAEPRDANGV